MMGEKISVVIPVRNEASVIRVAERNFLNQDYNGFDVEIYFVDNKSDDKTADAINRIKHPSIKLIRIPERGKALALKIAAKEIDNDIIINSDVDLIFKREDTIKTLYNTLRQDNSIEAVGVNFERKYEKDGFLSNLVNKTFADMMKKKKKTSIGGLYAIRKEHIFAIPDNGINDDLYLTAYLNGKFKILQNLFVEHYEPSNLKEFIQSRVRIEAGRYQLKEEYNFNLNDRFQDKEKIIDSLKLEDMLGLPLLAGIFFYSKIKGKIMYSLDKEAHKFPVSESSRESLIRKTIAQNPD